MVLCKMSWMDSSHGGRRMKNMRNKSETFVKIYNKYRNDQDKKIYDLQVEVRALTRMVEYLAKEVLKDE